MNQLFLNEVYLLAFRQLLNEYHPNAQYVLDDIAKDKDNLLSSYKFLMSKYYTDMVHKLPDYHQEMFSDFMQIISE